MLTMQYGRAVRDGVICVSYICAAVVSLVLIWEIGVRSKLESAVYPYGLSRQTPRSSVLGPDQLRRSVGLCV